MNFVKKLVGLVVLSLITLLVISCAEKKEGTVVVSESEFIIRQDSENAYVIDARGKVKTLVKLMLKI